MLGQSTPSSSLIEILESFCQIGRSVEHEGVALFDLHEEPEFFQAKQVSACRLIHHVMHGLMLGDAIEFTWMFQGMSEQGELPVVQLRT